MGILRGAVCPTILPSMSTYRVALSQMSDCRMQGDDEGGLVNLQFATDGEGFSCGM